MRRAGWTVVACLGLAAGPASANEPKPFWTEITVSHQCEAMARAYCVGASGYTIFSDGHWQVGPSPEGTKLEGRLTSKEQASLEAAVRRLGAKGIEAQQACEAVGAVPGSGSAVQLQTPQGSAMLAVSGVVPPDLKCHGGSLAARMTVVDQVDALLRRYYPRPFPPVAAPDSQRAAKPAPGPGNPP